MFRIVAGGIHIESSTFTPYISGVSDFAVRRGEEMMLRYPWYEKYRDEVEFLPLIFAGALPGGVVDRGFFEEWLEEFESLIKREMQRGKIDGVLLDLHGAMSVQGLTDAEGYLARRIRELAGEEVKISVSMDLHGNVTDTLFSACDFLTCYRTAPHIDTVETRERAFLHLLHSLQTREKKRFKVKIEVPILLPGEKTSTELSPGRELYAMIEEGIEGEEVSDLSIWMGFPWADEERCHGVVVGFGTEEEKVKAATKKIADRFWEMREEFCFVGPVDTVAGAIKTALEAKEKPFFISDTGDNPGAGGVGDMNLVLREFMEIMKTKPTDKKILFASLFDQESIEKIYEKREGEIEIQLGGKMDPSFGGPVSMKVKVDHIFSDRMAGRGALVHEGNLSVIITENRFQYGRKESFLNSGVKNFEDFDVIVVKMGYLEPDLSEAKKGWVMALSAGAVSQDITNLNYKKLKHPLFPFDDFKKECE